MSDNIQPKMDLKNTEVVYRAEGNANLVISLPEYHKVLRLQKALVDANKKPSSKEYTLDIHQRIAYMNIINTLLGPEYACKTEIIELNEKECERMNIVCTPHRPINRMHKDIIGKSGILMTDATLISDLERCQNLQTKNVIAIEIKPKQAWKIQEIADSVPDLFDFKNINKCRYCCMQYLKLNQSKVHELSKYCPIDLFSGHTNRMNQALKELLKNPQNNLRIFRNGNQCYGDYDASMSLQKLREKVFENNEPFFSKLITTCLLKNYNSNSNKTDAGSFSSLPPGCVLHSLYALQALARDNIRFIAGQTYEPEVSYEYLPGLLKKQTFQNLENLTPQEKYMIGATALDSSIMISLCEIDNDCKQILAHSNSIVQIDDRIFLTQVKILDIDPKSDNHFRKYVRQTNKSYDEAFVYLSNESGHID